MTFKFDVTNCFKKQFNLYFAKYHDRDLAMQSAMHALYKIVSQTTKQQGESKMFDKLSEIIALMKSDDIVSIGIEGGKVNVSYLEKAFHKELPKEEPGIENLIEPVQNANPVDGFTVKEVAELVGLSENSIRKKIRSGEIATKKFGSSIVITSDDVDKYLKSKTVPNGYKSMDEIMSIFNYSRSRLCDLMREYQVNHVRIGRIMYYDYDQFIKERDAYEKDILLNDGHRRGPVKFKDECKK